MGVKKNGSSTTGKKNKPSTTHQSKPFPIVGIGASAGGLEALEDFFINMPADNGMAFIVIQHLDPHHKGMMPELLQRATQMKVQQATDRLKVEPNCIYVIPPNKSLSILRGFLHLFDPIESHGLRLPVDIFFRSLAQDMGDKSIGIILSGMGSDGSLGLKSIKEKNGIVLVQEPASAKYDAMPRSAIDAVIVDIVAPVNELPKKLIAQIKLFPAAKLQPEKEIKLKSNIDKVIILIREHTGHDFSMYKKTTLFRRIDRRKNVHEIDHIKNYVRLLQENPKEIDILFKELLIGVTSFFRDAELWDKLRDHILPQLIKDLPDKHVIRAWVPGCSTGEEAYSLAIIFKEALDVLKIHKQITLQIFATDIDTDAIEKARNGYFTKNITSDVAPERISRFFTKEGDGYRINNFIREMVVFANQNVTKDPPFTNLDIISCRNMLIYMETELQDKLLALFNYSLNTGGVLVLGTAETPGANAHRFSDLDIKLKIFKTIANHTEQELINFPSAFRPAKNVIIEKTMPIKAIENIQTIADQILLQQFAPASVMVNSKGDIIYITGRTGKYLEPVAGKANWNIHAMARDELGDKLPGVFRKAKQNFEPVLLKNIKIRSNTETHLIDVTVQQIEKPESVRGMIMVVFKDVTTKRRVTSKEAKTVKQLSVEHQHQLEMELKRTIEDNQSIREEMQASQEELQSTNEELQSTNEELQSTNEELTTSKEEMQSLNEELHTINSELQNKLKDFLKIRDDMDNLINSTEIATLFLDKELKIRKFTNTLTNIFKIRDTDIGRPFTDLASSIKDAQISNDAHQVLKKLVSVEREVSTDDGKWIKLRIMPYRTNDDFINGLVITFVDITKSKQLETALRQSGEILRTFISKVPIVIIGLSSDGKIIEYNPNAEHIFGYRRDDVMGKSYVDLFIPEKLRKNVANELEKIMQDKGGNTFQNLVKSATGDQLKIEWSAHALFDEEGKQTGMISIGKNITKLKGSN